MNSTLRASILALCGLLAPQSSLWAGESVTTLDEALNALHSRYFDRRQKAVHTLTELGKQDPDTVGGRVLPLLEAGSRIRLLAIRILGEIEYKPALAQMARNIGRFERYDPLERAALIEAFVKFGADAEAHILETGADRNPVGRMILGRIALTETVAFIKQFFGDEDGPGWFDGQFDALKPRGKSAVYALMLIVESYFTPGKDSLLGKNEQTADYIRWLAAHGLGEFGDPVAVPLLEEVFRDLEGSLTLMGDRNIEATIRQAKRTAAIACWKCGNQGPLTDLIREIREEIEDRRSSHPTLKVMSETGDFYWDLAVCLSTLDLIEEVVEAYKKYVYWKRRRELEIARANDTRPSRLYAIGQYNIACTWARAGMPQKGLEAYYEAIKMGYKNVEWAQKDGDLESVHKMPEFDLALAYTYVEKMKEALDIKGTLRENRNHALFHLGQAVSRGLIDPAWITHRRFAPLAREAEFHWHVARFHARAGRADACAEWLRSGLDREAALHRTLPPDERLPVVHLRDILFSGDFEKVRDHADVRKILEENGLLGDGK